jgi:hypothetical protein
MQQRFDFADDARLAETCVTKLQPEDTSVDAVSRLARNGTKNRRQDATALRADSAISFRLGSNIERAVPMSWMRNGPPDQGKFHRSLVELQAPGLARFARTNAARRMSLVEEVVGVSRTAQFELEKPKLTAVSWNSNYGPHGWHRYVGRFPPHVVRSLLNHFGAGSSDVVCDPFTGSGTTAVECRLLGIPFVGIEICPLSALISRTKATFPTDTGVLRAVSKAFTETYRRRWTEVLGCRDVDDLTHDEVLRRPGNLIPSFTNVARWFTSEALLGVSIAVELAMGQSGYTKDALLLALSSKMRSIGNVDVDVVRAEYSKKPRWRVDVGSLIASQLKKMSIDIEESLCSHGELIGPGSRIMLREGSVLDIDLGARSVSHVITSPPYGIEVISYLRTHLLSYRSLAAELKHDPYDTRAKTIGSEYMEVDAPVRTERAGYASRAYRDFFASPEEDPAMEPRRRAMQQFFEDMYSVGERMSEWLVDGGQVAFIIGNKRLGGRVIPTDVIIKEIFEAIGLNHKHSIKHKLKTNNSNSQVPWQERIIQEESILMFKRERR